MNQYVPHMICAGILLTGISLGFWLRQILLTFNRKNALLDAIDQKRNHILAYGREQYAKGLADGRGELFRGAQKTNNAA